MGVLMMYQPWCVVGDSYWEDTRPPVWKVVIAAGNWMVLWYRLTFALNRVLAIAWEISSLKSDARREGAQLRHAYREEADDWDTCWSD